MQDITDLEAFLIQDDRKRISLPAMIIFVHTITALKTHFEDEAENRGAIFKPENALYTYTVPAIWSESAKEFMRKAAIKVMCLHCRCMNINVIKLFIDVLYYLYEWYRYIKMNIYIFYEITMDCRGL